MVSVLRRNSRSVACPVAPALDARRPRFPQDDDGPGDPIMGKRFMVVDDSATSCRLTKSALLSAGAESVVVFTTGAVRVGARTAGRQSSEEGTSSYAHHPRSLGARVRTSFTPCHAPLPVRPAALPRYRAVCRARDPGRCGWGRRRRVRPGAGPGPVVVSGRMRSVIASPQPNGSRHTHCACPHSPPALRSMCEYDTILLDWFLTEPARLPQLQRRQSYHDESKDGQALDRASILIRERYKGRPVSGENVFDW